LKASFQRPYDYILYSSLNYDSEESLFKSSFGYVMKHLFSEKMDLGIEIFNFEGESLWGGKLFLRKELWPANYGLLDINDHIAFYLLKNRKIQGAEENLYYRKKDQTIIGVTLKVSSYGPYFDPQRGWKFNLTGENAGHLFGGKDYFYRISPDFAFYLPLFKQDKIAFHLKAGFGYPQDKILFQLGGDEGLRGYARKTVSGSNILLGSLEYRFSLIDNLRVSLFNNLISLDSIQGVIFSDTGIAWYKSFSDSDLKKNAGIGLIFYLNIASFLEKICLRLDFAQAINEPKENLRVWFSLGHAF
jgi:outer membrane protein assembly factor BamA